MCVRGGEILPTHNCDVCHACSPLAGVAGLIPVLTAASAPSNPPHILVALGGVLGKVYPCTKHATDVGVALVKPIVDDVVDEWRACDTQ